MLRRQSRKNNGISDASTSGANRCTERDLLQLARLGNELIDPPKDEIVGVHVLGHRLEQRRLGLRHRAVDLVDEQDVREYRPGPELEVPGLLVVDREAG